MIYPKSMAKETVQFLLRLPAELRQALSDWAADERRSVTAHIVYLLEQAVARHRSARRRSDPQ